MDADTLALIDPSTRQRTDARLEVPITLGDGQTWHFPMPKIVQFASFDDMGELVFRTRSDRGPAYDALLAARDDLAPGDEAGAVGLIAKLVRLLLLSNYDLSSADLGQLIVLQSSQNDAPILRMWQAFAAVAARGQVPTDADATADDADDDGESGQDPK